ncbi:hypothetical protein RJ639_019562 [Escallonia herrerae]|uniref:2Fe-2S ferredoxin-type domain-containing protein n=1 Tax=Escallonia herrerae TaxID=1293975 RepID=A0AA88V8K7_9ASTE|nr:hypothetical protein RJ639_019562 [Escallonia herrerae]
MAAIHFASMSLRPPEFTSVNAKHQKPTTLLTHKRLIPASAAANSPDPPPAAPDIELEFIGPKPGGDGKYPVERANALSGDKLLRTIMSDNKIELYATYVSVAHFSLLPATISNGKLMNCGGGGSCGTCIVEVIDGKELLNERTNTELRYLKKAQTRVMEVGLPNHCWKQRKLWQGSSADFTSMEEVILPY